MIHRAAPPQRQRAAVLATVFAFHAALIALFLQQSGKVEPVVRSTSVAMLALDANRPAGAKPPPPAPPAIVANTFKPMADLSISTEEESNAPAGTSAACSTPGVVLDALLLDLPAIDAIRNAPPEARSVADAIVMWNEGWSPAAYAPEAPLFIVRAPIERGLSELAANCLDEPITGPRLVPVADETGTRTIFLVFGSGTWTWRALLTPSVMPRSDGQMPATVAPLAVP